MDDARIAALTAGITLRIDTGSDTSDELGDVLTEQAVTIRDEDEAGQRELFLLFNRIRDARDDEDYRARDALETVIDRISGWCEPRHRLYP